MEQIEAERPHWRKALDFPLLAMVVSVAILLVANALGIWLGTTLLESALPAIRLGTAIDVLSLFNAALTFVAYKALIARLGESPRDDLRASDGLAKLPLGLAIGFAMMAAVLGIAAAAGVYAITRSESASDLFHELVASAVVTAFMEELLFRGILFRWLEEFGGSWAALLLSSLAFGFAHAWNPGASATACLFLAAEAGLLLGAAYMLTRSLWLPMGIHAAWNFTEGGIFGVPDSGAPVHGFMHASVSGPNILSGGEFGPEASVITLAVGTSVGIYVLWLAIRRGKLIQPVWMRGID